VFGSNGLVDSITTLALLLPFWPVIDRAFGSVRRLWRPAKTAGYAANGSATETARKNPRISIPCWRLLRFQPDTRYTTLACLNPAISIMMTIITGSAAGWGCRSSSRRR
jgi:hypothetical protein